ncbi:WW domain-containing protein [Stagonosporopsis vannaccii]|nr:WW domain-containing protein [Stagonosporopsis vannaccii]
MPLNSFRDAIGHVENALYMMKGKRDDDQGAGMAYGNHYPQYHNSAPIPPQHPPPPQNYGQPPYSPPSGWSQHWDQGSQRYYYIEQATGRSQWEPPVQQYHQPPRPTSSSHQQRSSGDYTRGNGSGEYKRQQHLRPHSNSNASQMSRNGSPLPRAMSIPPGYSLDMKTGQLVNTMLPPAGHHSAPVKYW